MRRLFIVIFCLIASLTIYLSLFSPNQKSTYPTTSQLPQDEIAQTEDLQHATDLISRSEFEKALEIIRNHESDLSMNSASGQQWIDLFITISEKMNNIPQLVILYDHFPSAFNNHEKAVLLVADALLSSGRIDDFEQLREEWKTRQTIEGLWFALDADKMLIDGNRDQALDFLKSRSFEGKADTPRLLRLALIQIYDNPKTAWEYLTEALNKDPENPHIRSYRGKLLEATNKKALALTEYIAALQTNPQDPSLRDQLAEFYRRNHQYWEALQIWKEGLPPPSSDTIWLKALFWNKVTIPIDFDWKSYPVPEKNFETLIKYLINLKPGTFWNQEGSDLVPEERNYLSSQQVTFWLRLLQALKENDEGKAQKILQTGSSSNSWEPQLETALKRIFAYRDNGNLQFDDPSSNTSEEPSPSANPSQTENSLFEQLEYYASSNPETLPKPLQELLTSQEAFAIAFLEAGWLEAALQLHTLDTIPSTFPDWVALKIAQALQRNRGPTEALQFAKKQEPTPPLSLLIGELLVTTEDHSTALEQLTPLSKEDSDIGSQASWLISLIYLDQQKPQQAKKMILSHPRLAQSVLGKETLARIHLIEGNDTLAEQLYLEIQENSAEAKSYLARKAFEEKNWKKARQLTEELLKQFPSHPQLLENLKIIQDAELQDIQNQSKAHNNPK